MHRLLKLKNLKIALIFLLVFSLFTPQLSLPVARAETPQEKLDRLQAEINKIKDQKSQLQSQLNSNTYTIAGYNSEVSKLQGEAQLYQKDIDQLRIEIEQLEITIGILNEQIAANQKEIERSEATIVDLDKESSLRIKNSYMNYRMYGSIDGGDKLLVIDDINSYFKDSQYKEIIQSNTNDLMVKVAQLKQQLSDKKKELDSQLNEVKKSKEIVDIKKSDLDKKKEDVDIKLAEYYFQVNRLQEANRIQQGQINSLNNSERELNAEALLVMQQIMTTTITSGVWVKAGTIIGFQGCTGYCFGEHLHFSVYYNGGAIDPCGQIESGGLGCGSGGPLSTPLRGTVSFNSGFGYRSFGGGGFHDGVDATAFPYGSPVYAAHDGYVQRGLDCWHRDRGYPTNGCANYVKVYQNLGSTSGYVTGYWHLR